MKEWTVEFFMNEEWGAWWRQPQYRYSLEEAIETIRMIHTEMMNSEYYVHICLDDYRIRNIETDELIPIEVLGL